MSGSMAAVQSLVQRRRRELLLAAGITVVGYAGYRAWTSETATSWRQALKRAGTALDTASTTLAAGTEVTSDLLQDVKTYLESGEEQGLPPRLRQLAALLQSQEVGGATASTVAALWAGIQEGSSTARTTDRDADSPDALDRVLSALLSERGQSLLSLAVALGARNLAEGYAAGSAAAGLVAPGGAREDADADSHLRSPSAKGNDVLDRLLTWLGSARGQQVARRALSSLASAGVGVYCDRTMTINPFDQLLEALSSRHEHAAVARACIATLAREVVRSAFKGASSSASLSRSSSELGGSNSAEASRPASPSGDASRGDALRRLASLSSLRELSPGGKPRDGVPGSPGSVHTPPVTEPPRPSSRARGAVDEDVDGAVGEVVGPIVESSPIGLLSITPASAAPAQPQQQPAWAVAVNGSLLALASQPAGRAMVAEAAGSAAREAASVAVDALRQRAVIAALAVAFVAMLVMQTFARLLVAMMP